MLLISFSCSKYTKNISETEYAVNDSFSLEIDSIIIPLDSISLPSYLSRSAYYENDTCSLLFVFNNKTWNLDVFDLNKSKIKKHIQLGQEGKDAIIDVLSLQIITPDSFFIHDGYNFVFTNGEGKVLNRIYGVSEQNGYLSFLDITSPAIVPYFNITDNKIYGRYATTRQPYPAIEKELFSVFDVSTIKRGSLWDGKRPAVFISHSTIARLALCSCYTTRQGKWKTGYLCTKTENKCGGNRSQIDIC
jgi:hypothetical protein